MKSTSRLPRTHSSWHTLLVIAATGLAFACGGGDDSKPASSSSAAAPAASKPSSAGSKEIAEQVQQLSADARDCIDFVKSKRYVEAVDACERAMKDSANVANLEVKQAYDAAKAEVKKASQAAAVKAGSDMLEGKSAEEAAKGALGGAMGDYGKE